ncbi:hypothetical protein [Natronobacterium texcoconense]|uniref:Uncharacterized protein n=1 Tax=Natronobacterium texcoconense TaxID=1095778 RepID=A0A1H1G643_NATTX|nr:hypothetical protein [Natronobacterium texcoconense]SDR08613.1 hypothetical protein SAMN04489842_2278 [Natronobacterium texcoconense]
MKRQPSNNLEVTILVSISLVLFLDVLLGLSDRLPDGWFHLLLGVFLLGCSTVLFLENQSDAGQ